MTRAHTHTKIHTQNTHASVLGVEVARPGSVVLCLRVELPVPRLQGIWWTIPLYPCIHASIFMTGNGSETQFDLCVLFEGTLVCGFKEKLKGKPMSFCSCSLRAGPIHVFVVVVVFFWGGPTSKNQHLFSGGGIQPNNKTPRPVR